MAIFPGTLLGPYEVVGPLGAGGPTCAERSPRSNIAAIYGIEDRAIVMELVEGRGARRVRRGAAGENRRGFG